MSGDRAKEWGEEGARKEGKAEVGGGGSMAVVMCVTQHGTSNVKGQRKIDIAPFQVDN